MCCWNVGSHYRSTVTRIISSLEGEIKMDIKLIKELRAFKKEAQGNKEWLERKIKSQQHSPDFLKNASNLLGIYDDQIETAESMIKDEFNK